MISIIYKFKNKGYSNLKKEKKIQLVEKLKYDFEDYFNTPPIKILENYDLKYKNLFIKSTILNKILNKQFNQYLLFSYGLGKYIFFPAPNVIIQHIKDLNYFKINFLISKILWFIYKIRFFLSGSFELLSIFNYFFFNKNHNLSDKSKYDKIFFLNSLADGNFTFNSNTENVVTWIYENFVQGKNFRSVLLVHSNNNFQNNKKFKNIEIRYSRYPFIFKNKKSKFFFLMKSLKDYCSYFFKIFIKKYDFNMILMKDHFINLLSNLYDSPYDMILFNNSDYLSRPLWSYNKIVDSKVYFYFYSTNYFKFKKNNFRNRFPFGYKSMTWSNYIFWNNTHANHFRNFNKHKYIIIKKPVSFSDSAHDIKVNRKFKKIISIFNVHPIKYENYIDYCLHDIDDYYNDKNCIQFYNDLIELFDQSTLILIKEKRFNPYISKNYSDYTNKISNLKNVQFVKNNISPYKLINKSNIVISIPFSSASIMANYHNVKSYYYDPTNSLTQKDSPFKIKILNNKNISNIL